MAKRTTHPKCGKSWKTLRAEHCTVCHETFSGTKTGDAHRVGKHGVKEGADRRRCLPPSEVRVGGSDKNPGYPLRWNEERGYWSEDRPDTRFIAVPTPSEIVQQDAPGVTAQGGVSRPEEAA